MKFLVLVLGSLVTLSAQPISYGFKLGAPINDPTLHGQVFGNYSQGRWTGGPTVELHLPYRFSIEFDALYRNSHSSITTPFSFGQTSNAYIYSSSQKTNSWDFPLLLKYRFHLGGLRPFLSAGYQWTHQSSDGIYNYVCSGPQGSCKPADYPGPEPSAGRFKSSATIHGPAAGAGIDFKTRYVTISPEFRLSRPINSYPRDVRMTGLVGFTFGKRR